MGNRSMDKNKGTSSYKDPTNRMHIPEEILKEIFVRFEDIKTVSLLNKHWNKISSSKEFIAESFLHSKSSLLIQFQCSRSSKKIKAKTIDFENKDFELKPYFHGRKNHLARSVCNGLMLVTSDRKGGLFVMNTATKHHLTLPKCPSVCPHRKCGMVLGFSPKEKVYKVFHVYNVGYGFEILTIGSPGNKWRVVPGPFANSFPPFDRLTFHWEDPLVTDRHSRLNWDVGSQEYMVSMGVRDETFGTTFLPIWYKKERDSILEIGDRVGIVRKADTQFNVFVLRDPRVGSWEPLYNIDANELYITESNPLPNFDNLSPTFTLRDGNVLIFIHLKTSWWYFYDTNLGQMEKLFQLETRYLVKLLVCKSSLFHWNDDDHTKQWLIEEEDCSTSITDHFEPKNNFGYWNLLMELADE